jgi:voltage-gated sodium channel
MNQATITARDKIRTLTNDKRFEFSMMAVIIISAISVGVNTYHMNQALITTLIYLDNIVTIIFVVEITLRIIAEEKMLTFFKNGWNAFDFFVVFLSLIPIDENYAILARLFRIFRVLRLITLMPELKVIIGALFKSAKSIGYIMILMFIIFYIFAVLGNMLFMDAKSGLWADLGTSLLTLFRVMTFEDWTDVMYETMEIYPLSWMYYFVFIALTSFTFLNMIIGIIIETLNEEHKIVVENADNQKEEDIKELMQKMYDKIDSLEKEVSRLSEDKK